MSKKDLNYRQCHLRKQNDDGTCWEQVSWIPEPFCVEGKILKLRDNKGIWEDGWKVISAGSPSPAESVESRSRDYLQRSTK